MPVLAPWRGREDRIAMKSQLEPDVMSITSACLADMPNYAFTSGFQELPLYPAGFCITGTAEQRPFRIVRPGAVAKIVADEDYILVVVDNFHGKALSRGASRGIRKQG
jgi:hypothetical protein